MPRDPRQMNFLGRIKKTLYLHRGLILILLSCGLTAFNVVIVKTLGGRIPSLEVVICRQFCVFLSASPSLIFCDIPLRMTKRELCTILAYVSLIMVSFCLRLSSLENIPAADMTAIYAISPITTGILAWLILREEFTLLDAGISLVALLGVILIARPTFLFGAYMPPHKMETPLLGLSWR